MSDKTDLEWAFATDKVATVQAVDFQRAIRALHYGKSLPDARYILRPSEGSVSEDLFSEIRRAEIAARPSSSWNLLKLHTDQFALTFLSYPDFDDDPHPALAEATKINLNTGAVTRTDYRSRANPPILHRKETFLPPTDLFELMGDDKYAPKGRSFASRGALHFSCAARSVG